MKLAENRSARSHAHGRRQDRQRDGRDLSMGLSMNCSLSMPLQTGQTALTAAIQAWDRSFGAGQATCKAVVRGSSPLTGSLTRADAQRGMLVRGSTDRLLTALAS